MLTMSMQAKPTQVTRNGRPDIRGMRFSVLLGTVLSAFAAAALARGVTRSHLDSPVVPKWKSTWNLQESTIVMPCSMKGMLNATFFGQFGLVDIDWCARLLYRLYKQRDYAAAAMVAQV